jgi:hypothetical protein
VKSFFVQGSFDYQWRGRAPERERRQSHDRQFPFDPASRTRPGLMAEP